MMTVNEHDYKQKKAFGTGQPIGLLCASFAVIDRIVFSFASCILPMIAAGASFVLPESVLKRKSLVHLLGSISIIHTNSASYTHSRFILLLSTSCARKMLTIVAAREVNCLLAFFLRTQAHLPRRMKRPPHWSCTSSFSFSFLLHQLLHMH